MRVFQVSKPLFCRKIYTLLKSARMQSLKAGAKPKPDTASRFSKIGTIDEAALLSKQERGKGKLVVQAHGTFDLMHPGHLKHLEAARAFGDVLIVTLTADKFVNKGPHRPVFSEQLRAEMLAALEVVDYVAINNHPDAVPAILKIGPSFYVKGQDYRDPGADITGKIAEERQAVESGGGGLVFTDEITFSSTELLNKNFNIYEPHTREYLEEMRNQGGAGGVLAEIDKIGDCAVLVVGDAIIDEYQYVFPMGKAGKENLIATRYQDEECFAGGVFATANHLASFCKRVEIITILGEKDNYEDFIRKHLKPNVVLHALKREGAPTTRKVRFVDPHYIRKMFEVAYINDDPILPELEEQLNRLLKTRIGEFDAVIANDFGHGMIKQTTVDILAHESRFLAVNTQSNSANMGYNLITKYPRADFVCVDMPEARLALADKVSPIEDIIGKSLPSRIDCSKFIITHGKHGCFAYERGGVVHTIPAVTKSVVDTVGAGDAFLAVTTPMLAMGCPIHTAGFVGNIVGALKVMIVGHQKPVEKVDVIKSINALLK